MNTILERWESYLHNVIPKDASAVQIEECRRAFYAGGVVLMPSITNILEPGTEPTQNDLDRVTSIWNELAQFQPKTY